MQPEIADLMGVSLSSEHRQSHERAYDHDGRAALGAEARPARRMRENMTASEEKPLPA